MKKIILSLILILCLTPSYSQKKKPIKKAPVTTSVLAKTENLTAEIVKSNFYLFIGAGAKKDTILLKALDVNKMLTDCKITPFTSKGTKLYAVSWMEKTITETKLKKEEALTTFTEVCDIVSKSKVLSNAQTTTKITEIVFLDKNQTVSETREKLRKEGFEFSLTPDGDVVLKNKAQENRMSYSAADKKFVGAKKK